MLELYIAGLKADIPENFSVLFNYNSTEVSNPTAIKNKYSSSIILPGTPENNKLFGDIWKLGRLLIPKESESNLPHTTGRILSGPNFDARKRVDFKMYNNSELIESGYVQLLEVNIGLEEITYRLSLYGGLGDFFYSLQYDQDNVEKNLASLYWGWKPTIGYEDTTSLGSWDRNFILDSWAKIPNTPAGGDIEEDITAIPTYSGMYEDFSSDKVLVNVPSLSGYFSEASTLFPSSVVNDNKTYRLYDSKYALLETPRELDEWEARDLRAENQRVGVRFSSFFRAISNPQNNGGYTVVLDPDIENTPYFQKSWILLDRPEFEEVSTESTDTSTGEIHISDSQSETSKDFMYSDSQISIFDTSTYVNPRFYTSVNVGLDFEHPVYSDFTRFIPSPATCGNNYHNSNTAIWDSLGVRIEMYNPDTNALIANSDTFILRNNGMTVNGRIYGSIDDARDDIRDRIYREIEDKVYSQYGGTRRPVRNTDFKKQRTSRTETGGIVYDNYKSAGNITMAWEDMPVNSRFKLRLRLFKIRVQGSYSSDSLNASFWTWSTSIGAFNEWWELLYQGSDDTLVRRLNTEIIAKDSYLTIESAYFLDDSGATEDLKARSITKGRIFSSSSNPLKYLLDWTKMFDLRFRTDQYEKIVYIDKRQNYFLNETGDLRVDLAKGIKLDPTVAKYKAFSYGLPIPESYMSQLYSRKTSEPYGKVRLNTGYEFNNETRDLYEDSVYKALIPYAMNSYYFSHQGTRDIPSVALSPTYDYTLYTTAGADDNYSQTISSSWEFISSTYSTKYQDPHPKLCIFNEDDNSLSGVNSIVFFNGFYSNSDIQISDNVQAMFDLNESPCYLLSRSLNEVELPQDIPVFFNSYVSPSDPTVYSASFNFGAPVKEAKDSEEDYEYRAPIYYGFWDLYTQDLYSADSRSIQVYAFIEGRPEDMMRKFWYYDDSLWVIQEIKNYNISNPLVPTQMVLVRVENPTNYLT